MLGDISETINNNGCVPIKTKKENNVASCRKISKEFPFVCNKCIKCLLMNISTKEEID